MRYLAIQQTITINSNSSEHILRSYSVVYVPRNTIIALSIHKNLPVKTVKMATSTAPIRVFTDAENRHIDECYAFVLRLCREAGALVREGFAAVNKSIATKEGSWDLVTRYDQDVEKLLIGGIAAVYPEHRFVAEETAAQNQLSDAPTWIIDPIDGTVNFVHGIPLVAISIALLVRQEIAIGVVYNPITGELYRCRKGAGAFLNDAPIRCSEVSDLDGAIYAHEVSFMRAERVREKNLKRIHKFASLAQG